MTSRTCVFLWLLLAACNRPAFAQNSVGVGLQVGRACQQGRDDCAGKFFAPMLSLDLSERLVMRIRRFSFEIPDRTLVNQGVSMTRSNIQRKMTIGEFILRFRSRRIARPIIGVSLGSRRDSATVSCTPGPCGTSAEFIRGGPWTTSSVGVLAGVHFRLRTFLDLETSIGLHDLLTEHAGTTEAGIALTLKFRK